MHQERSDLPIVGLFGHNPKGYEESEVYLHPRTWVGPLVHGRRQENLGSFFGGMLKRGPQYLEP